MHLAGVPVLTRHDNYPFPKKILFIIISEEVDRVLI
jgi:hypothetical protein